MLNDKTDVEVTTIALQKFKDRLLNGRVGHIKVDRRELSPSAELYLERIDGLLEGLSGLVFDDEE